MPTTTHLICPSCHGVNRVPTERLASQPKCGRCKTALDADNAPLDVDDDQLQKLIRASPLPVLVDFWAPWCGPCRAVAPHLVSLAKKHVGALIVVKVNTDVHTRTAGQLSVRSIPTLALYKGGKLLKAEPGARMGAQLESYVAPHL